MVIWMNDLYNDLNIEAKEYVYDKNMRGCKNVYEEQKEDRDSLLKELGQILLTYTIIKEVMKFSSKEKSKLKSSLFSMISNSCKSEYKHEKKTLNTTLKNVAKENYDLKTYILSLGVKVNNNTIDNKLIEEIVNQTVNGKIWSDRLWDNKMKMEKDLKLMMIDFLNGKTTVNDIQKHINSKYSINAYNTKRLVNTEIARVQSRVDEEFFKEHGVKKLMYMATLDMKTCTDCAEFDGVVFNIDDVRPVLPRHPICRCCYVELPNNWKPIDRRDNTVIDKHIDFTDHEKWKKENNIDKHNEIEYNESNVDVEEFMKKNFEQMNKYYMKCNNFITRKWYKWHDENIPNLIDKNKSIEGQARQACELRNMHRSQARELMRDQEERKRLDIKFPNISFEELIKVKMDHKNLTREEAIKDILKTATKTNKEVNKSLGLE